MKHFLNAALLATALAMPLAATADAMAQPSSTNPAGKSDAPPAPPPLGKPDEPPVVMNYFVMLVILAVVIGANLIPSKRGHQD